MQSVIFRSEVAKYNINHVMLSAHTEGMSLGPAVRFGILFIMRCERAVHSQGSIGAPPLSDWRSFDCVAGSPRQRMVLH